MKKKDDKMKDLSNELEEERKINFYKTDIKH